MSTPEQPFKSWAILELMGHRQRAGFVEEVEVAGGKLLRIDIPVSATESVTEFYGTTAVYALRPTTEEIARKFVQTYQIDPRPVAPVGYRLPEPRPQPSPDEVHFTDPEDGDDDGIPL